MFLFTQHTRPFTFKSGTTRNVWGSQCPPICESTRCAMNRVASCGITLLLEVFWTGPQRGWGVRCAVSIPIGQFICEYVGAVATDEEAVRPIRTYVNQPCFFVTGAMAIGMDQAKWWTAAWIQCETTWQNPWGASNFCIYATGVMGAWHI